MDHRRRPEAAARGPGRLFCVGYCLQGLVLDLQTLSVRVVGRFHCSIGQDHRLFVSCSKHIGIAKAWLQCSSCRCAVTVIPSTPSSCYYFEPQCEVITLIVSHCLPTTFQHPCHHRFVLSFVTSHPYHHSCEERYKVKAAKCLSATYLKGLWDVNNVGLCIFMDRDFSSSPVHEQRFTSWPTRVHGINTQTTIRHDHINYEPCSVRDTLYTAVILTWQPWQPRLLPPTSHWDIRHSFMHLEIAW